MNYYKNLFRTQHTGLAFILLIACIGLSFFIEKNFFTYLSFILCFTIFDVVGYGNMIHLTHRWNDETMVTPYRIMRNFFMVITFVTVYFYTNWLCLLACFIGWWMGGCDLLYYILLRIEMREEDYYWMKGWSVWLVITWFRKLFLADEYISKVEFITICSIGLILGGLINYVKV